MRLKDLTRELRDSLVKNGFEVVPDGHGSPSVKFEPMEGDLTLNRSLIDLLSYLARQGVAFENDIKQTYPPSYAMVYLRENGLYEGDIIGCGYDGYEWRYEIL